MILHIYSVKTALNDVYGLWQLLRAIPPLLPPDLTSSPPSSPPPAPTNGANPSRKTKRSHGVADPTGEAVVGLGIKIDAADESEENESANKCVFYSALEVLFTAELTSMSALQTAPDSASAYARRDIRSSGAAASPTTSRSSKSDPFS